jgi:hypothetical protein
MINEEFYLKKYLKYKSKYLNNQLDIQHGGEDVKIGDTIYSVFDFDFNFDRIKDEDEEKYFFNEREEHGLGYVNKKKDKIDEIRLLGTVVAINSDDREHYIILDNDLTFFLNSCGFLWFNLNKKQQSEYDEMEEERYSFWGSSRSGEDNPKLDFLKRIRDWYTERNVIQNIWPNSFNVGDLFFDHENRFSGHITGRGDDSYSINTINTEGRKSVERVEFDTLDNRRRSNDLYTIVPFRDVHNIKNLIPRLAAGDLVSIRELIEENKERQFYDKCSKYCPGCDNIYYMERKFDDEDLYSYILQSTEEPLWHTLPCRHLRGIQNELNIKTKDRGRWNSKLLAFVAITAPLGYRIVKSTYTPEEIEFNDDYDMEWSIHDVQIDSRKIEEKRKALALKTMLSSAEIGYKKLIEKLPDIKNKALETELLAIIHEHFHRPK